MLSYLAYKLRGSGEKPSPPTQIAKEPERKLDQDVVDQSPKRGCDPDTCNDFHCIWCAEDSEESSENLSSALETSKNSNSEADNSNKVVQEESASVEPILKNANSKADNSNKVVQEESAPVEPTAEKTEMKNLDPREAMIVREIFNVPKGHKQLPNTRCYYCLRTSHEFLDCSQALVDARLNKVGNLCVVCGKMKMRRENCCDKKEEDKIRPDTRVALKNSQSPRQNRRRGNKSRTNGGGQTRSGGEREEGGSSKSQNGGRQKSVAEYRKERLPFICKNQATQTESDETPLETPEQLFEGEVPWDEKPVPKPDKVMCPSNKSREEENTILLPTILSSGENREDIKKILSVLATYFPEGTDIMGMKIRLPWSNEPCNVSLSEFKD